MRRDTQDILEDPNLVRDSQESLQDLFLIVEKEFARQTKREGIRAQAQGNVRGHGVHQEQQVGPVYQEFQVCIKE